MSARPLEGVPPRSRRRRWPTGRDGAAPDAADVYRALAPAVLGYVRSQRAAEPEDLLGEIFLQVVRDLPRFRGDGDALRRWVFTIAHHRLVDARRRTGRRPALDERPVPDVCSPPPPDPLDPDLLRALGELTAEQREVVALRFVADLPIDAVATLTGRSPGAVKALQHRALAALADCILHPPESGPPRPGRPSPRSGELEGGEAGAGDADERRQVDGDARHQHGAQLPVQLDPASREPALQVAPHRAEATL